MNTLLGIFILFLIVAVTSYLGWDYYQQKQEYESRRKDIAKLAEKEPLRAKPAWDSARITLESYFRRNLTQINAIFWLSVIVMSAGFAVIFTGLSRSIQQRDQLLMAVLTTGAGVITQIIGATFLLVYKSTIKQAINYSRMLERINSVGMAMQILDTMPDDAAQNQLKNDTKAKLVNLLVQQGDAAGLEQEDSK